MTRTDTTNWTTEDLQRLVRELEDDLEKAEDERDEALAELDQAKDEVDERDKLLEDLENERDEAARIWIDEATEAQTALERGDNPRAVWQRIIVIDKKSRVGHEQCAVVSWRKPGIGRTQRSSSSHSSLSIWHKNKA